MTNVLHSIINKIKRKSKYEFVPRKYIKQLQEYADDMTNNAYLYKAKYRNSLREHVYKLNESASIHDGLVKKIADKDREIISLRHELYNLKIIYKESNEDIIKEKDEQIKKLRDNNYILKDKLNAVLKVNINNSYEGNTKSKEYDIENYGKYIYYSVDNKILSIICTDYKSNKANDNTKLVLNNFCIRKLNPNGRMVHYMYIYNERFGYITSKISREEAEKWGFFYEFGGKIRYCKVLKDGTVINGYRDGK